MGRRTSYTFYAVRVGRNPGIYYDAESCEEQVKGYSNAKFQKFRTEQQALDFIASKPAPKKSNVLNSYQFDGKDCLTENKSIINAPSSQSLNYTGKFYAVKEGFQPGIYNSWEECEKQVLHYSGSKFKKCKSREEAIEFITGVPKPILQQSMEETQNYAPFQYYDNNLNDTRLTKGKSSSFNDDNQSSPLTSIFANFSSAPVILSSPSSNSSSASSSSNDEENGKLAKEDNERSNKEPILHEMQSSRQLEKGKRSAEEISCSNDMSKWEEFEILPSSEGTEEKIVKLQSLKPLSDNEENVEYIKIVKKVKRN